jgi:hypothetical protein
LSANVPLSSTSAAVSDVTATLKAIVPISGTVSAVSTTTADLTVEIVAFQFPFEFPIDDF